MTQAPPGTRADSSERGALSPRQDDRWHLDDIGTTAQRLETNLQHGLTGEAAAARLLRFGRNELARDKPRGLIEIVGTQFVDLMIVILIIAAVVSGLMGELGDTLTIVVIVILNASIGAAQEYRAQQAVEALREMSALEAVVVRDGETRRVSAAELVPGDLVMLEAGNVVPADLRLIEVAGLEVDESTLTGESLSVGKGTDPLADEAAPVSERLNMTYKSTSVSRGRGRGLVVATGSATEIGRIAGMLTGPRRVSTPLQRRLTSFSRRLAVLIILICAVIFTMGLIAGQTPQLMLLVALSLAVAAIPEALPAVVTVSLALGARKLGNRRSLVRKLQAVESLGSVTCICSDKTGTLTENRMTVAKLAAAGRTAPGLADLPQPLADALGRAMALCNDVEDSDTGDPTELALIRSAEVAGYRTSSLKAQLPIAAACAFDTDRKLMTTLHARADGAVAYTKGAPEQVISVCTAVMDGDGRPAPLADRQAVLDEADRLAAGGYRVLGFATRSWAEGMPDTTEAALEADMVFVGLAVLHDPIRPEVPRAIEECRSAGIRTIMITGDHPATARQIGRELGLTSEGGEVLTGRMLSELSDDDLRARVAETSIYARVDPADKIRIVEALQANGELVAMTGDGVNDAPALRQATIGVAMGRRGTDVARETADLVLLDDNFATIVTAVREGRRVYSNIRKFIRYTMTSNTGEIAVLLAAGLAALPMPLVPIQILWINLVTDGLPGLAFSAEPNEADVMEQPPRPPAEGVFARGLWQHMLFFGLLLAAVSLVTTFRAGAEELAHWQTMVFTTLVSGQLFQALALRSETSSLFRIGWLTNPWMLGIVMATMVLQVLVVYLPFFNVVLHTTPLPAADLAICLALGAMIPLGVELEKWLASARRSRTA